MTTSSFLLMLLAVPIIAYVDYTILRSSFEAEYQVKVKWTYWIIPTAMEVIMFLAGGGLMWFLLMGDVS